ncbi:hypothetical protein POM88_021706 [Heracleum sosnowskyi]|uniref:Ubiquitin-like protease family profile domain-containing protein n=1 Tax=Heracleum sosnowskyi TaxID=360622 RepID=A0AAD8MSR9_9APIA|nr:hypothetical protein POM88_021706 [Heracleum sosnowskyi]
MAPKRQISKVQIQEDDKQADEASEQSNAHEATEPPQTEMSESVQATEITATTSNSTKKRYGASRGVSAMYKVVVKKVQGKKTKVRCNELGVPVGQNRHPLQSYTGMLARTIIPIDCPSWRNVDVQLKEKLWLHILETFKVSKKLKKGVLKSASAKWRQFKTNLNRKFVKPNLGQKKKLRKPPNQYAFVGKEAWKKFVAQRITDDWKSLSEQQSNRVRKRKYPHRMSRKGYIGLLEEEQKKGNLKPGEKPDRSILWKKARKGKDGEVVDPELVEDTLLEKQSKGEFSPCGSEDVLTKALETPEHSGRVRGVGSFVTPSMFFNLPTGKRCRITKAELLARDRERDAELEKAKQEMERTRQEMERTREEMVQALKAMGLANIPSPKLSEMASCGQKVASPSVVKDLDQLLVDDDDCVPIKHIPPENKGPRKSWIARVSVDGPIKGDALIPIPVVGEIETVDQAVGSHVSWPRDLIIINAPSDAKTRRKGKEPKSELHKVQALFKNMEINKNVPNRFRLLYKHATTFMKTTRVSIQIPCNVEVFGSDKTIFILHENIIALMEFKMIGQAIISSYMAYLHSKVHENDNLDLFAFCDPGATFTLNSEFEAYLFNHLKEGNPDRLFLLPHNTNCHWILVLMWGGEIFVLNPLHRSTTFPDLEKSISRAVVAFNIQAGRGNKAPTVKYLSGCPKQPGGIECVYVVMRYMKEIWSAKSRKLSCSKAELDEVRCETAGHIEQFL